MPSRGLFPVHLCSHEQDTHRIKSSKSVFILCFYCLCVFILRFEKETRGGRVNCRVAVKLCKCLAKAGTQRGHGAHGAAKEKKKKKTRPSSKSISLEPLQRHHLAAGTKGRTPLQMSAAAIADGRKKGNSSCTQTFILQEEHIFVQTVN